MGQHETEKGKLIGGRGDEVSYKPRNRKGKKKKKEIRWDPNNLTCTDKERMKRKEKGKGETNYFTTNKGKKKNPMPWS